MMKHMKKFTAMLLAVIMVLGMAMSASADDTTSHTITITNEKVGHTYEAYQVFKGTISDGKLVDITWGSGVNTDTLLAELKTIDTYGEANTAEDFAEIIATFGNDSEVLDEFAEIVAKHLTTVAGTSEADKSPYEIDVNGDGYYLVKDADDSVTADEDAYTKYILKVVGDVTVTAKADAPSMEKKIIEVEQKVDANNGSIGDIVNYELTSKVPDMDGYDKYFFVIHDTLSNGLVFDMTSVVVKIGEETLVEGKYDVITTGLEDGCTFEIVLKDFIQYKEQAGEDIIITYSAVIDDDAVIGNTGNPNTVHLEYSNNPNVDYNGSEDNPDKPANGEVTGETPDDYTITYVTGIELIKVNNEDKRLTGAEFEITGEKINKVKVVTEVFEISEEGTFYKLKDGSYTEEVPDDETTEKYEATDQTYLKTEVVTWNDETVEVSATATVGEDGVLRFDGLAEGTYTITEIKAPAGYNLLKGFITVVITCEEPKTVTGVTDTTVWKYTTTGAVATEETVAVDGRVHITVENQAGSELPSTGGIGTTIFYIAGAALVLAAVVMLVTKRRMKAE